VKRALALSLQAADSLVYSINTVGVSRARPIVISVEVVTQNTDFGPRDEAPRLEVQRVLLTDQWKQGLSSYFEPPTTPKIYKLNRLNCRERRALESTSAVRTGTATLETATLGAR
jgi:hypothetical protein